MSQALKTITQPGEVTNHPITPMDMLQIALEKGADLDQMTKLMDLQERWEANEARKAFVTSLNAFKANPPSVTKNKSVGFGKTSYDHATLDHVSGIVGKALSQHGISHRWDVQQDEGLIKVTCILTHALGHSVETAMQSHADTSGSKNPIQAIGSAVTYLQRYTLLAATGMAAGPDTDGTVPGLCIPENEARGLEAFANKIGADIPAFLTYLGVDAFADIPDAKLKTAWSALEKKAKQMEAQK